MPLGAVRREVPFARLHAEVLAIRAAHRDLDLPPVAVLRRIRRQIAEAVLRADLREDPVVGLVDLLHRAGKERLPSALGRDLRQLQALLLPVAAALVLEK